MTHNASHNDPAPEGRARTRTRLVLCPPVPPAGSPVDPRSAEAERQLRAHACLSDREVSALRERADALGPVKILGANALGWSVAGYVGAALLLGGALVLRPHWVFLTATALAVAVGGLAERAARRGYAAARRECWRLEDELAKVSAADMAWVRAYASHSPALAESLATWTADGRRLRERDLAAIRRYVQTARFPAGEDCQQ